MGGGIIQLAVYGAQDVYLTGNPQITFFKMIYRRHTNFCMESVQQTFNGTVKLGNKVTVQITRNGDMISFVWLKLNIKADADNTYLLQPFYGLKILKSIELEIGGQRVDKHYAEWMYIWNELTLGKGKHEGYYKLVGANKENRPVIVDKDTTLYIPLQFWFCRNVGLALPLIALQYHEVKINIEFSTFQEISATNVGDILDDNQNVILEKGQYNIGYGIKTPSMSLENFTAECWVDYIFLDTDERRNFAQQSHEYLIEQLQHNGSIPVINRANVQGYRINFNHTIKELIWVIRPYGKIEDINKINWNNFTTNNQHNNYKQRTNPIVTAKLLLNGNDRFKERKGNYFSIVQPYQHHTSVPKTTTGINLYSFALTPEDYQPTGTLNMSRIDTAILNIESSVEGSLYIYAVNYNVLRILSGMGGLAYSN